MLTGRPPFAGDSPIETLDQVRFADPVPPSRLRPRLPRDLETIALACLRKEPARRYPSAAGLADDLDRFLAGRPVRARPVGAAEKVAKWGRRRPAVAGLLVALVLLIATALVTSTALWRQAATARDAEGAARLDERRQREQAEARSADLLIANARYAWLTDDLDAARTALAEVPAGHRTAAWAYLHRACSAARLVIPTVRNSFSALAYSPDGRLLAGAAGGRVLVWDADTGEERLAVPAFNSPGICSLALAPGGRLAVAWQGFVGKGDAGRTVAIVRWFDLRDGKPAGRWQRNERGHRFVLSPGGRRAAFIPTQKLAEDRDVLLLDAETGKDLHRLPGAPDWLVGVAFSPDGSLVATQGQMRDLKVWEVETGRPVRQFVVPSTTLGLDRMLTLSADGRRVALGVHTPGARPSLVVREAEREVFRSEAPIPMLTGVAASPDGRLLAGHGQNEVAVPVWEADTGQERLILRGYHSPVSQLAFRPGGRELAAGYQDGRVVIWTVDP